jgi:Leucine-rich repeat (LRR) protein
MDIGPHHNMHKMQMHQSRSLVNDDDDDDMATGIIANTTSSMSSSSRGSGGNNRSNNNISFVTESRRPLVGGGTTNDTTYNNTTATPSYRQNEHNLAMMQDIVIEQILSGDLHSSSNNNSYHSHASATMNNVAVAAADVTTGPTTTATNISTVAVNMMKQLSTTSIMGDSSNGSSKFSRFSSSKIPLVSKIMAPYRDNPSSTTSRMMSEDTYFPHRSNGSSNGGGIIDLNQIDMIEEINLHDHDQMPDVESYKASAYHRSTNNNSNHNKHNTTSWYCSRNRVRSVLTIVSGICICVFCTLLGVLIGHRERNDYGILPPNNDSSSSSSSTSAGYVEPSDRYAAFVQLVKDNKWSKDELVDTINSYQNNAIDWIANKDTMKVPISIDSIQLKQRYALAVLYYSLNGINWNTNLFFLSGDKSECEWYQYWSINTNTTSRRSNPNTNPTVIDTDADADVAQVGVVCNTNGADVGIISRLFIPSNNLHGEMPAEISLLTELREINFYNNEINGIIHGTFSALTKLEAFVLYQNQIRDVIPTWIGEALGSTLQVLNWGKNDIYGIIPSNFGLLTKLETFNCESCNIQGTLNSLQDLATLQALHLGENSINGQLSESLFTSWPTLMELDLSNNQLSGTIPRTILDNEHLLVIDLHSNNFSGEIYDVNPGSNVRVLALHNNQLTGRVDEIIANLNEKIHHLDISNNKFVGSGIPASIGRLTDLRYLYIAKNRFDRESIPTEIGLLTNLRDLSFQDSSRIGNIPYEIKNCKQLTLLDLNNNALTGQIPDEIGSLSNLRFILLRENALSGSIPESFYQLTNLDTLLINSNRNINGETNPICLPALQSLRIFRAECSKFTGTSPMSQCPCCTACCESDVTGLCTEEEFFTSMDPSSEYQYVRRFYRFNEQNVIFPVATVSYDETPLAGTPADKFDDEEPGSGQSSSSEYTYGGYTSGTTPTPPQEDNTKVDTPGDAFEEYYEDQNGEDVADTAVIDSSTYEDQGKQQFQYKPAINNWGN